MSSVGIGESELPGELSQRCMCTSLVEAATPKYSGNLGEKNPMGCCCNHFWQKPSPTVVCLCPGIGKMHKPCCGFLPFRRNLPPSLTLQLIVPSSQPTELCPRVTPCCSPTPHPKARKAALHLTQHSDVLSKVFNELRKAQSSKR